MFSFLIVVMYLLCSVFNYLIKDVKNNNYKYLWKRVTAIIVLLIAVYLKSMGL